MTTFVTFTPSTTSTFQFQAMLDGSIYTVLLTWNVFGQRFYVNVYSLAGVLIVAIPLIGSPVGYDINMVAGYFTTSSLVYRADNGQFEISP